MSGYCLLTLQFTAEFVTWSADMIFDWLPVDFDTSADNFRPIVYHIIGKYYFINLQPITCYFCEIAYKYLNNDQI